MKGVSGQNLQMAPTSGNIYLKANKNVTVSCFPRLYHITLMSVFSPDKSMQAGTSAAQHSEGPRRAARLPLLLPPAPAAPTGNGTQGFGSITPLTAPASSSHPSRCPHEAQQFT